VGDLEREAFCPRLAPAPLDSHRRERTDPSKDKIKLLRLTREVNAEQARHLLTDLFEEVDARL
jgi:hypothetical protein